MGASVEIKPEIYARSESGASFLVLGARHWVQPEVRNRTGLHRRLKNKLERHNRATVTGIWGTLGMADGRPPAWSGRIQYSERGEDRSRADKSSAATIAEIDAIRELLPESRSGKRRIIERFISFEDVEFHGLPEIFSPDKLPRVRLTVMLQPGEGALVYYQMYRLGTVGLYAGADEVAIEAISPTAEEPDRVTYEFALRPSRAIEDAGNGRLRLGADIAERFVVKVLTFRRNVNRLRDHFGDHNHELKFWRPGDGAFRRPTGREIDRLDGATPTLLLIHGTASHTEQAFSGLLQGGKASWIAARHGVGRGRYRQILAFDHPTFSEDAGDNVAAFRDWLPRGFAFSHPIDVITHSRGGLVAKYLALDVDQRGGLPIRRGALVACANGVGYFKAAARLSLLLSVLRAMSAANLALLMALQKPIDVFRDLPGSQLMTPRSDALEQVLAAAPPGTATRFLPIVGDFDPSMPAEEKRLLARWTERGLDALIKAFLGRRHDWVVGTREQLIVARGHKVTDAPGHFAIPARHSDYFPHHDVQSTIADFLKA